MGSVRPQGTERPKLTKATVFVSDPSVEAERISQALRGDGYAVVDVPLAMLVARVAVQRPRVVLVDADADGAPEIVARMRELPDGESIDVLYIGRAPLDPSPDAQSHAAASGFVMRPVDVGALVKKIESLNLRSLEVSAERTSHSAAEGEEPEAKVSSGHHEVVSAVSPVVDVARDSPPPPRRSSPPPSNRSAAILPPPSMRVERQSQPAPSPGSLPSLASSSHLHGGHPVRNALVARRLLSLQGPLSSELAQLLAEAENRVGNAHPHESSPPSPDEEIEAVLPEEILAALDEPLAGSEAERELSESHEGPHARVTTSAGASKQTTGTGMRRPEVCGLPQPTFNEATAASAASPARAAEIESRDRTYPAVPPPAPSTRAHDVAEPPARAEPRAPPMFGRVLANDAPVDAAAPLDARTAPPPPQPTTGAQTAAPPGNAGDAIAAIAQRVESHASAPLPTQPLSLAPDPMPPAPPPRSVHPPSSAAPGVLGPTDAPFALARAIASRVTGTLCFDSREGVRRAVLREGDLVTCASGVDDESLIAYLVARGDLPREKVNQVAGRFATFGRHAGAALVAQGYLRQDQLWPVLRGHAEWILGRALLIKDGTVLIEPEPPGRLRGEPSVFGGSTGAEVFVEVLRRVIAPEDAILRMGGVRSRIGEGPKPQLLTECALGAAELAILEQGRGLPIEEALDTHADTDMGSVLYALSLLGVIDVARSIGTSRQHREADAPAEVDALDADAIRARVRTRLQLVDEGDYFAILGVPHTATGYEVRRAFLELRRAFEPARLLTPRLLDLASDVRKIVEVLEEAYEILRDGPRRERYRRAIGVAPEGVS